MGFNIPVQVADDLQISVHQAVHPELSQNFLPDLLIRHGALFLDHRVLDVVVKDSRRNHLVFGILPLQQLLSRIHVDHQLQLKTIVEGGQVEMGAAGFVVDDFYIELFVLPAQVQTVDAPSQPQLLPLSQGNPHGPQIVRGGERHLKAHGGEISPLYLLAQCPDGPLRHLLHPSGQVGIAGTAHENGIAVLLHHLADAGLCQLIPLLIGKGPPVPLLLLHLPEAQIDGLMEQISHIHRLQAVLLALQKFQPVAQEMGVGAGGVLFHPGHASLEDGTIECLGGGLSDAFFLIGVKGAIHQPLQALPLLSMVQKEPAQLQKVRLPLPFFLLLPAVPVTAQPLNQHLFAVLEGIDHTNLLLAGQNL